MSRDPTIIGIRLNMFKTIWASGFKFGKRLWLSGFAHYDSLQGSTVGYPSDSLASCSVV